MHGTAINFSVLLAFMNIAPEKARKGAYSTRSIDQPSAAVVVAEYVRAENLTCEQLIDACPDDAYVLPETVHAEAIRCKVRSDRASCTFTIKRNGRTSQCRGPFEYVRNGSAQSWAVAYKRNRFWSRLIKCENGF